MELPFTAQQFFDLFETYNHAVWPAQLIAYGVASIAALCVIPRSWICDQVVSASLALFWLWNGVVYHLRFFTTINEAAYLFGVMFIFQALLFLWFGNVRGRLVFGAQRTMRGVLGCAMLLYAMFGYTLVAIAYSHQWPRSAMFGVTPCTMTIFTAGMLLWTIEKAPWQIWVIPTLWSAIGLTAAFMLGMKEDLAFIVTLLVGISMIIAARRRSVAGSQ